MTKPSQKSPNQAKKADVSNEKIYTVRDGTLQCSQCDYKANRKDTLLRHFERHKDDRDFECSVCSQKFKGKHDMRIHMRQHSGLKPFKCQNCEASFKSFTELQRHIRYKHTHEKPYKCTECSYAAVERSKLARHMLGHTGERPYQCSSCPYATADQFKLKRHLRIHTGDKPYKCEKCHMEFTQTHMLNNHLRRVHSRMTQDKYTCNICHATYPRKLALQNLHENTGPQQCTKCDSCFTDMYSLKSHVKLHKQSHKYKCNICPHVTRSKKTFSAHIQQHNGKVFKCKKRDKILWSQDSLNQHKQCHKSQTTYECNNCGKAYTEKCNLKRHIQRNCSTPASKKLPEMAGYVSQHLMTITNKLKNGEVLVLPEKGGEKYVMIEILPNENVCLPKTVYNVDSSKNEMLKEFYVEIENNRLEVKLELETDVEITDDDEEPFYGF